MRRRSIIISAFVYFLIGTIQVCAQVKYRVEQFTTADGLNSNIISSFVRDNSGYLWMRTEMGLARYDGYQFTNFNYNPNDSEAIYQKIETDNGLFLDKRGNIWIRYRGPGMSYYDWELERFVHFKPDLDRDNWIGNEDIQVYYTISQDEVWIGTTKGLFYFSYASGTVERIDLGEKVPVGSLMKDNVGNLWVGTGMGRRYENSKGLFLLDSKTEKVHKIGSYDHKINDIHQDVKGRIWLATNHGIGKVIGYSPDIQPFSETYYALNRFEAQDYNEEHKNMVQEIFESTDGQLWFGLSLGIAKHIEYSAGEYDFKVFLENGKRDYNGQIVFRGFAEDRFGNIWAYSNNKNFGLAVFNKEEGKLSTSIENHFNISSPEKRLISLFLDDMNTLWIGTDGEGVLKLDLDQKKFFTLQKEQGNSNSLISNSTYAIDEDENGQLWIGTGNGISKYNPVTGSFQNLNAENSEMNNNNVISILADRNQNHLWLGHSPHQVSKIDKRNWKNDPFKYVEWKNATSFYAWTISDIEQGPNNNVWFATHISGVYKSIGGEKEFVNYRFDMFESEAQPAINTISFFKDGNLWIGTTQGLYMLDMSEQKIQEIHSSNEASKIGDGITSMIEINQELWLGTQSGGLLKYDKETRALNRYTDQNGLRSNSIMSLVKQNDSIIWMSTIAGLSSFNTNSASFTNYDTFDGLPSNGFNLGCALRSSSGHMYFGGPNGIVYFHPDTIKPNPYDSDPVITGIQLFNQKIKPQEFINDQQIIEKSILTSDRIVLSHVNNILSFTFSSMHFASPENNRYAYKLENLEEDWNIVTSDRRVASYTSLPHGDYTFKVRATNSDGIWSEQVASVDLQVLPPWWNTSWFRFVIVVVLMVLVYLLYRLRVQAIRSRNVILERLVEEKTEDLKGQNMQIQKMAEQLHEADQSKLRFFMNVSHELRTPLTLILGPISHILQSDNLKPQDREQATIVERNAHRLLRLTNQILDTAEMDKDTLKLKVAEGDVIHFLRDIFSAFEYRANHMDVNYKFISSDERYIGWFDGDKLEKILYNLISNAFKFVGPQGVVSVDVEIMKNLLSLRVIDDGVGIPDEDQAHIFDLFYQVDNRDVRRIGAGIGLSLAKKLAINHKGDLSVRSEKGQGTTFTLEIPLEETVYEENEKVQEQINAADRAESIKKLYVNSDDKTDTDSHETAKPLILMIEDSSDMRSYLQNGLGENFNLVEATNGMDGLKLAEQIVPDLILSDIMMPGMDGMELCEKIKENEYLSHIPVILLTAKDSQESKIDGFQIGADDYLTKPFDMELLRARIHNIISNRIKLREAFVNHEELVPNHLVEERDDQVFLEKAVKVVENHLEQKDLNYKQFVEELGIGKTKLYDRINKLTGQSINIFIRSVRLKIAARLIIKGELNFSQISYKVGFSDPSYFSKCFKIQFGMSPKDYFDSQQLLDSLDE